MNKVGIESQGQEIMETRKPWEKPCIVLERSLQVSAQGGPPSAPNGFIGPLGMSGNAGSCGKT